MTLFVALYPTSEAYLEFCQIYQIWLLAVNCLSKTFHLRCLRNFECWYFSCYFVTSSTLDRVKKRYFIWANDFPANTSTLNQRWNNVDPQRSSTLFQRWYLVENESSADVHLSTLFQRWQNNVHYVHSTSMNQRCFNVEIWLKNESLADVCLSTLFQHRY